MAGKGKRIAGSLDVGARALAGDDRIVATQKQSLDCPNCGHQVTLTVLLDVAGMADELGYVVVKKAAWQIIEQEVLSKDIDIGPDPRANRVSGRSATCAQTLQAPQLRRLQCQTMSLFF